MIVTEYDGKKVEIGDKICALEYTFEIAKILSQEYYDKDDFGNPDYWNIEFEDPKGNYHHYKSQYDKGRIIPKEKT